MKKLSILALAAMIFAANASAQYFSTSEGQSRIYKTVSAKGKETVESSLTSVTVMVTTAADGIVSARVENHQSVPDNPLAEITTYSSYSFNPATDITDVTLMSGDDFKNMIVNVIKEAAIAAGQHISEMEMADLEQVMNAKGEIAFAIDPKAAAGTKIKDSTLRLVAGQMTMSMNLWQASFGGIESVTTDAGTYDCAKVNYTLRTSSPDGNQKQVITEWYAKGVGMVKSVETDKKGNVIAEETLIAIKEAK